MGILPNRSQIPHHRITLFPILTFYEEALKTKESGHYAGFFPVCLIQQFGMVQD
ncbi:hypothetical protein [Flavobacterium aestuarii]|uniref:hypothetical protein n=1 Tax=Flavobacterium aestuarii TaxID=3149227 RepID=UPI0032B60352